MPPPRPLPIDPLLPAVVSALARTNRVVVRAAPGAGKTTRVPAALLDAKIAKDRRVLVVEPRRVAARAAAEFVARERGGAVGGEVGYRVRFARQGGAATKLWFLTEGVLGRDLVRDPFLEDVGVVVLDEFHERHLQSDVALAVVRELQDTVRPDLRLVVMSATLESEALAVYLGNAAVLTSEGRAHPVDVAYDDAGQGRRLDERVAAAVRRALEHPGDVLVFLPGAGEIRRAARALAPLAAAHAVDVVTLHGDQPLDEQARALRAGPRRRVVLATNVAETALTVEGVTTVVDSGLARVASYDPRTGLDRLRLAAISRSSATQRAGRAGRIGPGRCLRLWSRAEEVGRRAHELPEIRRVDLARAALELAAWSLRNPTTLAWLDAPPPGALERARVLLRDLGALAGDGWAPTPLGRRLLTTPVAPRLGRMLVEAEDLGAPAAGALVAALASERDVVRAARAFGGTSGAAPLGAGSSDLLVRADLFAEVAAAGFAPGACERAGVDPHAVRVVERTRRQLRRGAEARGGAVPDGCCAGVGPDDDAVVLRAVLAGFPDRVCRRREPGGRRAVMVGGTGVELAAESVVRDAELFVAVEVEGGERGSEARVRLASAIERAWLAEVFPGSVTTAREVVWDRANERIVARTVVRYHDLVLDERVRGDVPPDEVAALLGELARADPQAVVAGREDVRALAARVAFLGRTMPELALPEPAMLVADAVAALAAGARSFAELRRADVVGAVAGLLTHRQRAALAEHAPSQWPLPSGRRVPVDYPADRPPTVAARIQELFGLAASPRLGGGRVAILFELLAPSGRPMQVTDDLASFWRTTYARVRAELRGRYPKHPWPDDPLAAAPTSRAKRR
ncbi:MAG: DEAD/DEAH box helicase [Deltaproteobacteria bacterium]|nr:DEAD/DEAH box helicase [Deltaproteobacteria bacterium]